MTGRTLYNAAKEALKNMKKLTAFALKNGIKETDPLTFHSGDGEDDVDARVLRDFYNFTKGKPTVEENQESVAQDEEDSETANTVSVEGEVPDGWYPT